MQMGCMNGTHITGTWGHVGIATGQRDFRRDVRARAQRQRPSGGEFLGDLGMKFIHVLGVGAIRDEFLGELGMKFIHVLSLRTRQRDDFDDQPRRSSYTCWASGPSRDEFLAELDMKFIHVPSLKTRRGMNLLSNAGTRAMKTVTNL